MIKAASAAVFQAHRLAGREAGVTAHPAVVAVRDCAKRVLGTACRNRNEPVSLDTCMLLREREIYKIQSAKREAYSMHHSLHVGETDRLKTKTQRSRAGKGYTQTHVKIKTLSCECIDESFTAAGQCMNKTGYLILVGL